MYGVTLAMTLLRYMYLGNDLIEVHSSAHSCDGSGCKRNCHFPRERQNGSHDEYRDTQTQTHYQQASTMKKMHTQRLT